MPTNSMYTNDLTRYQMTRPGDVQQPNIESPYIIVNKLFGTPIVGALPT